MKKSKFFEMSVTNEDFCKIKKDKITHYVISNNDDYKDIFSSDKVILINEKGKKTKKKIKKVTSYKSFNAIYDDIKLKKMGFKNGEQNLFEEKYKSDMDDNGLLIVQFKKKKRIFFKIFFSILILIMIIMLIYTIKNKISDTVAKRFNENFEKIASEKIDYVFVEINPSFVLKTRNDVVLDVACMNDDCMKIYDKIDVLDKNVSNSIEYLYQLSSDNGFNTDGNVSVKSTGKVELSTEKVKLDVKYITENDKDLLMGELKNNKDIVSNNNNQYYDKLWNELKKDKDYDEVYTCSFNNGELECYFIMDSITPPLLDLKADILGDLTEYSSKRNKIVEVFNKFGIKNISSDVFGFRVYIDNKSFSFTPQLEISNGRINEHFTLRMIIYNQIKKTTYTKEGDFQIPNYEFGYDYIKIEDIDLLNPSKSINKMVKYRL